MIHQHLNKCYLLPPEESDLLQIIKRPTYLFKYLPCFTDTDCKNWLHTRSKSKDTNANSPIQDSQKTEFL